MDHLVNVENENVDEKLEMWKARKFPVLDDDHEKAPKVMMDKELYLCAMQDNFNELFQLLSSKNEAQVLSIIDRHVGPSGNSLLHGAVGRGSRRTTELLVHHFPLLITRENFHGDTALHIAAGEGCIDTTHTLLNYFAHNFTGRKKSELLWMRNDRGNTGLHEAVMNGKDEVAKLLASEDPEILYCKNNEDKCPLYLAVEANNKELFYSFLDAINAVPTSRRGEIHKLLGGKSVAHAAVELNQPEMLREIAKRKPELMRVKDENGDNLLHFASKGYPYVIHSLLLELGLGDCAIETNNEGHLPIHVACQNGHLDLVNSFLDQWPNPTEFLDKKGQNVLHVAAENGQEKVIRRILDDPRFDKIFVNKKDKEGNTPLHLATKNGYSMSVYALVKHEKVNKDIKNSENLTAYYIALYQAKREEDGLSEKPISNEEEKKVEAIRQSNDGQIHKTGNNEQARSMRDVHDMGQAELEHATDGKKQYAKGRPIFYYGMKKSISIPVQGMTLSILYFCATDRNQAFLDYMRVQNQSDPPLRKELKSRINSLLVVSVLVAGVTFAGAIQLPAGGNFDLSNNSTLTNSKATSYFLDQHSIANTSTTRRWYDIFGYIATSHPHIAKQNSLFFRCYAFFDMAAFNASLMSSIILCWAQLYDTKVASCAVWVASIFIGLSIYMMCLAFTFAMGIAVSKFLFSFIFLIVLEGILFFLQTVFSVPLLRPTRDHIGGFSLSPRVYYIAFRVYYSFHMMLECCSRRQGQTSNVAADEKNDYSNVP